MSTGTLARQLEAPPSTRYALGDPAVITLPEIDAAHELAKVDAQHKDGLPLRFAHPVGVDISTRTHGTWTEVADGRVWRLKFDGAGATDLNFGFEEFALPDGATFHFVSHDKRLANYYDGPYTRTDNQSHGEFWSPPLPGGEVTLELYLPKGYKGPFQFRLTQVATGFRDVFKLQGGPGLTAKQGACNNDVICPEGDPWRDQIRSVAAYTVGGIDTCTGTMVMDANSSFTPYFLTAFHCGVTAGNAASVVTIWNYESMNCGDLSGGSRMDTVSGTIFRARRQDVDMGLLELSSLPPAEYLVYWAGWDRSDNIPNGSVGIHHPGVDEKAISFNLDPLAYVNNCIGGGGSNTHWEVDNWEDGTTEPGSSGSAIFDPANQLVVGFLSGGTASCSSITSDCYGRFGVAWDGGSSDAERLSPWLDPSGTGAMTVQGSNPADFAITLGDPNLSICRPDDGVTMVSVDALPGTGFSDPVTLGIVDVPAPLTAGFDVNPVSPGGSAQLTIGNTGAGTDGTTIVQITGTDGSDNVSVPLNLGLFSAIGSAPALMIPAEDATDVSTGVTFTWDAVVGAETYFIEIATDDAFNNLFDSATVSTTSYRPSMALSPTTTYHWRVTADNACNAGMVSVERSFTTGAEICTLPGVSIPDNNPVGVSSSLMASLPGNLEDLNVAVEVSHTYVGDLIVSLEHVGTGTTVILIDRPGVPATQFGCSADDIDAVMDDAGSAPVETTCDSDPALGGTLIPQEPLSGFNGISLAGEWRLTVSDNVGQDTGTLDQWCLLPTLGEPPVFADGFEGNPPPR